jgi:hypothetical protein
MNVRLSNFDIVLLLIFEIENLIALISKVRVIVYTKESKHDTYLFLNEHY